MRISIRQRKVAPAGGKALVRIKVFGKNRSAAAPRPAARLPVRVRRLLPR